MLRWLLVFLVAPACLVGSQDSSSTGGQPTLTCVPLVSSFCSTYITHLVPSTLNQTDALNLVQDNNKWNTDAGYFSDCPFYANTKYQCFKHLPVCTPSSTGAQVRYMCRDICYAGKTYSDGICRRQFPAAFFDAECLDNSYYSDEASCTSPDVGASSGPDQYAWWKIFLAVIMSLVGLALVFIVLRQWWRNRKITQSVADVEVVNHRAGQRAPSRPPQAANEFHGTRALPPANRLPDDDARFAEVVVVGD